MVTKFQVIRAAQAKVAKGKKLEPKAKAKSKLRKTRELPKDGGDDKGGTATAGTGGAEVRVDAAGL